MRVGQGRRKAIHAATMPRSPEFLARRERSTPLTDRLEGRDRELQTVEPPTPPEAPLTIRMTCPDHGQLVSRPVACRHELDAVVEEVRNAHFAEFGAGCDQPLTVRHGGQGAADG